MLLRRIDAVGVGMHAGDNPEIYLNATAPFWEWAQDRPSEYDEFDDREEMQNIDTDALWDVWYKGLLAPEDDGWTKTEAGVVPYSVDGGTLSVMNDSVVESVYWQYDVIGFENSVGVIVDCRMRIETGSSADRNVGACISVSDGARQFVLWIRADGLNIDGQHNVAIDMTVWRRVQFITVDDRCEVLVDGVSQQVGLYADWTSEKRVYFGSWCETDHLSRTKGLSRVHWDWLRARAKDSYRTVEEYELMIYTVSQTLYLYDFSVGQEEIYEWRHGAGQVDEGSFLAIFEGADSVWASTVNGFTIETLDDGKTGSKVRIRIKYIGTKNVIYDVTNPYDVYGPDSFIAYDEYFTESTATGSGVVTLQRKGVLADAAYV